MRRIHLTSDQITDLHNLVGTLERRGVRLSAIGEKLGIRDPHGVIDDDIRWLLRRHKESLLWLLEDLWPDTEADRR
jgi:hypothetical protein